MAGLLGAQQIAGAPDFQIPHGDLEAGAELGEIPDGTQPFFRDFRQIFVRAVGEVGVGVAGGAANPSPQLMKLAQAEPVGVFNNQGVGVGDVQAGLDDGGAHQHLNVPVGHGLHHITQSVLTHLAVGHADTKTWNPPLESTCALVDGLRPVMEVIDLTAPLHLPADGIVNDGVVVLQDEGLHRVPVCGGFLNGGHIPDAGQSHIQGSGNGGSGQGQHVHTLGHFLQTLLVGHAEALLLVNDQ